MTEVEKQALALKETLDNLTTNSATKEEVNELSSKIEKLAKIEDTETLKESLKAIKEDLNQIKERGTNVFMSIDSIAKQVDDFVVENYDQIKSLHGAGNGVIELEIKAVGTVTSQSAQNVGTIPNTVGTQLAPARNANLRDTYIDDLIDVFPTSQAAYAYTETYPKDGDFGFVAEGAVKPQTDLKIETRYATPVKVAGWVKLTDEAVQDIKGLRNIVGDYLRKKHDLKRQKGILFGDGIAPNPKGATLYGRAFTAGSMAGTIFNPNIMDAINAGITDVYTTHNYDDEASYRPSLVLISPVDFFVQFVGAKDLDGRPLYPTASLFNMVNIGGVTVVPERDIPAGKIFIADLSKYNVTDYIGYRVKIGWVNDDFIKNQFVVLGESRFHAFVRKLDEQAFIYDDIETIITAIKKEEPVVLGKE